MRGKKGFTLIEIVVAMAILGIGLVLVLELFGGGLRLGRTSEEYTRAVGLARMKMEEVSLAKSLEEGIQEGDFERNYHWTVEVKKVDLLPPRDTTYQPPADLFWIRVDVSWKSGLQEKSTTAETYRVFKKEGSVSGEV